MRPKGNSAGSFNPWDPDVDKKLEEGANQADEHEVLGETP